MMGNGSYFPAAYGLHKWHLWEGGSHLQDSPKMMMIIIVSNIEGLCARNYYCSRNNISLFNPFQQCYELILIHPF